MRAAALLAAVALSACTAPAARERPALSDGTYAMGTVLEVTLRGVGPARGREVIADLFGLAKRYDGMMSSHAPQSELARLNASAGGGPQTVSPEVVELLRRSLEYTELTRGSFDVTVGPLVELWIRAAVEAAEPDPSALERAHGLVGAAKVRVQGDGRVELTQPGVSIDLGGIAKGFAVDRMRALVEGHGVEDALIDFGRSSTFALGRAGGAAGRDGWRLLVRGPGERDLGIVTLRDQALSVSSSFGAWTEIGGRRYGHVIDPRSGRPLEEARQAVIVARDATLAEALSKALLILEPAQGIAVVEQVADCEGMLVDSTGRLHRTSGFDAATRWQELPDAKGQADSSADAVRPIRNGWQPRI